MNLMSLPEEMLASICKYHRYDETVRLRKTNKRVNSVCKAYGCGTRIPVPRLVIYGGKDWRIVAECWCSITAEGSNRTFLDSLDYILERITVYVFSVVYGDFSRVDDNFLKVLENNGKSFRNLTFLHWNSSITGSVDRLNNFSSFLVRLRKIRFCGHDLGAVFRSRMFVGRKWDSIRIYIHEKNVQDGITNQFLCDATSYCKELYIAHFHKEGSLHITVSAIVDAFKIAIKNGIRPQWEFKNVQPSRMSSLEVKRLFETIPDCEVECFTGLWMVHPLPRHPLFLPTKEQLPFNHYRRIPLLRVCLKNF